MKPYQVIMLVIILYFLIWYVGRYYIDVYLYKRELRVRKTGPPRAFHHPLQKPKFFNIKLKIK